MNRVMPEVLVEEYRGGVLECAHVGHICGMDGRGIRYAVGNPEHVTFLRSAAKPFQAIPAIRRGIDERFGLTGKETAITVASHRGEPFHIEAVESILDKIGLSENALACAATYPLNPEAREAVLRANGQKRKVYHNCSGKHAGVLALCRANGYDTESYCDPNHPAQKEIVATLSMMSEVPAERIAIGVDGCGFPVFALPLSGIAKAYLKLACPDLIADAETREAVKKLTSLMNRHPEMVAGTDFICSVLLEDDNIVAKGGAKGVYGIGLKAERMAFALKVMDGSEEEWPHIVAAILEQIGYSNKTTIENLYRIAPTQIRNDGGKPVGESRTVFRLREVGAE